jgi:uncharacterized protein
VTTTFPTTGTGRRLDLPAVLIAIAAAAISYGVAITLLIVAGPDDPGVAGVSQYLVSGLAPIVAVAVVYAVRVRGLAELGIRRVRARWLLIAAAAGVGAILLNILAAFVIFSLTGPPSDIQADYQAASAGGPLLLVLSLVAGAMLTPLGEELLFRGVLANWLLRFGPWLAVPLSSAIFAVAHGINYILPIAFIVGVVAVLLFRATGSIWPGVVVHAVNNGYSVLASALAAQS